MGYLLGQMILLLVLAVLLGFGAGYLVWGRRHDAGPRHAVPRRPSGPVLMVDDMATGQVRVLPRNGRAAHRPGAQPRPEPDLADPELADPEFADPEFAEPELVPAGTAAAVDTDEAEPAAEPAAELPADEDATHLPAAAAERDRDGEDGDAPHMPVVSTLDEPGEGPVADEQASAEALADELMVEESLAEALDLAPAATDEPEPEPAEAAGPGPVDAIEPATEAGEPAEPVAPEPAETAEAEPAEADEAEPELAGVVEPEPEPVAGSDAEPVPAPSEESLTKPEVSPTAAGQPETVSHADGATNGAAPSTPDDLRKVSGVGPATVRALAAAGITTYRQLAGLADDSAALAKVRGTGRGRIDPGAWRAQARQLHEKKYGESL